MLQKNSVRHTAVQKKTLSGTANYIGCTDHSDRISASKILSEEFPYIYVAMLAVIAFLFVFDFKVFKPDKKCMLAFVVIGALIAVKMFLL